MPLAIEDHVDFSTAAIRYLHDRGQDVIEPTHEAETEWVAHTNELADATLLPDSPTSWYMGDNVPGKPRRVLVYLGGAPAYRARCDEVVTAGYDGFRLSSSGDRVLAQA